MGKYIINSELKDGTIEVNSKVRNHKLISDEITAEGGNDAGPNPVEYLGTAVNSCIAISAGAIAKANSKALQNFHIENRIETKKLPHSSTSVVSKMHIRVNFDGIPADKKQKFLSHALHVSTVYKTLTNAIEMEVKLAN